MRVVIIDGTVIKFDTFKNQEGKPHLTTAPTEAVRTVDAG